jgi:hypothetical protein
MSHIKACVTMVQGKLLRFPMRDPDLFSQQINCQVLRNSEFDSVLYAAIRALPQRKKSTATLRAEKGSMRTGVAPEWHCVSFSIARMYYEAIKWRR